MRRADQSSKESYQLSISERLRNLIRGSQGPTWAAAPLEEEEEEEEVIKPVVVN
jgi:hypothetical protein